VTRKSAFAPLAPANARILILGSLPGEASLAAQQYYAHPQNRFWHLVGAVIDREELPTLEYGQKLELLASSGIALWDTVASAQRKGSLDAAIREVEPAPLGQLVASLPALQAIGFNGSTASRIGRRQLPDGGPDLIDLPSSSPAHASMPFAQKREKWLELRRYLP